MTVARAVFRELAAEVLRAANTSAGPNVFTARNWPTTAEMLPALFLQVPVEIKSAWAVHSRSYTTRAQLEIVGRVTGGSPADCENALDTLCGQVEQAILLSYQLQTQLQSIGEIHTELAISAETGKQLGEARIRLELSWVEQFLPQGPPLQSVGLLFETPAGVPLVNASAAPNPQS